MKKCIVYLAALSLLLSLGTVCASAEDLPEGIQFTPGTYLDGNADEFTPVGDITVAWRPDFAREVDMTDGDLSEWYALGLNATSIDANNMVAWMGDTPVRDFKIITFCAADADYLYLAFDIVDGNFAYGNEGGRYDGDAIQLALDFGRNIGNMLDSDPDVLANPKNIFYSLSCEADGAPIQIMRQESDVDKVLSEANGDGIRGAAKKTDNGWSAEIALSWQLMYDDWVWKAWNEDGGKSYVGSDEELPMQVGASLYYINRAETAGEVLWAAGAIREWTNDNGEPCVSWTAYDNAITWTIPAREDLTFNCGGIVVIPKSDDTMYPDTDPPETEPPYDPPVEETETQTAVEWYETIPPEVEETLRDVAESLDKEDELNAVLAKYGCTSVLGMGSLGLLTALAAAAYVARKKH